MGPAGHRDYSRVLLSVEIGEQSVNNRPVSRLSHLLPAGTENGEPSKAQLRGHMTAGSRDQPPQHLQ